MEEELSANEYIARLNLEEEEAMNVEELHKKEKPLQKRLLDALEQAIIEHGYDKLTPVEVLGCLDYTKALFLEKHFGEHSERV